jgi:lactate dehydrogenase-like 2-hydroxyacid dehydrogenase
MGYHEGIIYGRYPEPKHASDTEDTISHHIAPAKEAWHAIDERVLQHLSDTMSLCFTVCRDI